MLRAKATLDLQDAIDAELARDGEDPRRLLADVEQPLALVLAGMERTGIAADTHYLSDLESHFAAEVKAAAQAAYAVVGREFNLGSPKQLQDILFVELGLPKTKRIKTGYTTDADALQGLYAQTAHPVLEHLLRHRDVAKLKSTVDGLLKSVSDDGRIHTTFYPDGRGHRPAVQHRPEPAERADPHRGGPPDPARVHRRRGLREPDDRRLQPDRDADHGPPVARRGADRGVPVRARTSTPPPRRSCSAMPLAEIERGAPAPGQGDELRPGVRAVRVRPVPAARHQGRGGAGADGRLLRPLRRGARLPARRWWPRPGWTATPRPCSAVGDTCPT